jgi:hypothetical protein
MRRQYNRPYGVSSHLSGLPKPGSYPCVHDIFAITDIIALCVAPIALLLTSHTGTETTSTV